jgi:biotin carboxylase
MHRAGLFSQQLPEHTGDYQRRRNYRCRSHTSGYGFLAENAHFAEICESCKISFIGPNPENIRLMGDKMAARTCMQKAGLPIVPGSRAIIKNKQEALKTAKEIGYPVIIKAAAGGGARACVSAITT